METHATRQEERRSDRDVGCTDTVADHDPLARLAGGRVRIAWIPDDRPGGWMCHCHILEHLAAGMMAHFEVVR